MVIKQEDLKDVIFQDVKFDVKKRSTIRGVKYEYTCQVVWNGNLAETALEQASMHQAKNEYNNTRPSSDLTIMTAAECMKREDALIKLSESGEPKVIEAVSERARAKVKKYSAKEIVENLSRKDLPEDQKAYWQAQYNKMKAEAEEALKALNAFKNLK